MKIDMMAWEAFKWDGGSRHNSVGLFIYKNDAAVVAGVHGYVRETQVIVFNSIAEYEEDRLEGLRERTLEKLSPQEREVLGLSGAASYKGLRK